MNEFKVASLIALSHLSKLLINLFIIKKIAILHGPEGLGFLGNFMTLIALATTLSGGGIVSGIIKYISEYSGAPARQHDFTNSALMYTLFFAFSVFIIGYFFASRLTSYVFLNQEYKIYIYFFLFVQFFVALINFAFGLCNGYRETGLYAIFTISGNLIAFIIAYFAISCYGFWGAIVAIAAPAFSAFVPLIVYLFVKKIRLSQYLKCNSLIQDSRLLSRYSLMLVCSAICFPVVEMIIRNMIVHSIDMTAAGYWQAISRLSSSYLSFYSLFLAFYFVPVISATQSNDVIFLQVKKMVLFLLALFIPMMVSFYLFKDILVQSVFSSEFLPVVPLFLLQMIGDLFRVLGWVIGFVVVAKALSKVYILSEILQAVMFISLSTLQLNYVKELRSVVLAYTGTCVLYCLLSFLVFYYIFRYQKQEWVQVEN